MKLKKQVGLYTNIPKNPYRSEGINDKEFEEAVIENRLFRQKKYGNWRIMR